MNLIPAAPSPSARDIAPSDPRWDRSRVPWRTDLPGPGNLTLTGEVPGRTGGFDPLHRPARGPASYQASWSRQTLPRPAFPQYVRDLRLNRCSPMMRRGARAGWTFCPRPTSGETITPAPKAGVGPFVSLTPDLVSRVRGRTSSMACIAPRPRTSPDGPENLRPVGRSKWSATISPMFGRGASQVVAPHDLGSWPVRRRTPPGSRRKSTPQSPRMARHP